MLSSGNPALFGSRVIGKIYVFVPIFLKKIEMFGIMEKLSRECGSGGGSSGSEAFVKNFDVFVYARLHSLARGRASKCFDFSEDGAAVDVVAGVEWPPPVSETRVDNISATRSPVLLIVGARAQLFRAHCI